MGGGVAAESAPPAEEPKPTPAAAERPKSNGVDRRNKPQRVRDALAEREHERDIEWIRGQRDKALARCEELQAEIYRLQQVAEDADARYREVLEEKARAIREAEKARHGLAAVSGLLEEGSEVPPEERPTWSELACERGVQLEEAERRIANLECECGELEELLEEANRRDAEQVRLPRLAGVLLDALVLPEHSLIREDWEELLELVDRRRAPFTDVSPIKLAQERDKAEAECARRASILDRMLDAVFASPVAKSWADAVGQVEALVGVIHAVADRLHVDDFEDPAEKYFDRTSSRQHSRALLIGTVSSAMSQTSRSRRGSEPPPPSVRGSRWSSTSHRRNASRIEAREG